MLKLLFGLIVLPIGFSMSLALADNVFTPANCFPGSNCHDQLSGSMSLDQTAIATIKSVINPNDKSDTPAQNRAKLQSWCDDQLKHYKKIDSTDVMFAIQCSWYESPKGYSLDLDGVRAQSKKNGMSPSAIEDLIGQTRDAIQKVNAALTPPAPAAASGTGATR